MCVYVFNTMSLFDSSQSLHFFLINDRERTRNSLHSVLFFFDKETKREKKRPDTHKRTVALAC